MDTGFFLQVTFVPRLESVERIVTFMTVGASFQKHVSFCEYAFSLIVS